MRILVTGSRGWTDRALISRVLTDYHRVHPDAVLVHGDARGADRIAAGIWSRLGGAVEPHPADWRRYGRAAGPIRNREMVDAGADLLIGFWLDGSRGTKDAIDVAKSAGIPFDVYTATTH